MSNEERDSQFLDGGSQKPRGVLLKETSRIAGTCASARRNYLPGLPVSSFLIFSSSGLAMDALYGSLL